MTITMYGADWCGDCLRAKAYFKEHNVLYDFVDLIEHPDEVDEVLRRNGGVQRIPVIVFDDDSHLVEPSNAELEAKLASLATEPTATEFVVSANADANRYELHHEGELVSYAEYSANGANITIPHVRTLEEFRGNGYAGRLMDGTLDLIREANQTVTPVCPFAAGHIRRNPQYVDLLSA